uniref:Uncharacterized protein n=1 Tax=Branchiostoma floridae TaxID=7739 RepID=C3XXK8_BRAFL|eukprot:XP_002611458.1 hypothetical protein BRAFLDRAFT_63909 [Branchiostoma floridae]
MAEGSSLDSFKQLESVLDAIIEEKVASHVQDIRAEQQELRETVKRLESERISPKKAIDLMDKFIFLNGDEIGFKKWLIEHGAKDHHAGTTYCAIKEKLKKIVLKKNVPNQTEN